MLQKIKKGGDKEKKQGKKEKKVVQQVPKQVATEIKIDEENEQIDLVDIDYTQKEQKNKNKAVPKKKNKSELEEAEIAANTKLIQKKKQEQQRKTWVANNVQEALGVKFDLQNCTEEFQSLTNQQLNKKLKQEAQVKKKQKPATFIENGITFKPLEKTADQIAFEKAERRNVLDINETRQASSGITFNTSSNIPKNLTFTNSSNSSNITTMKIQKSAQELKLEQAQKRQQELVMKKKNEGWLGTKKTGQGQKVQTKPKISPWVINAQNNASLGVKFAPLQPTVQQKKLAQSSGRKQQEFVFVSKAEQEQRRKKREQKERLKQTPVI